MMGNLIHFALFLVSLWLISGTLLNFSKHPHWYIRGWDFPRVFVAILAVSVGVPYYLFFYDTWWDLLMLLGLLFVLGRQLVMIFPYLPFAPKTVEDARRKDDGPSFRLVMSNVQMENQQHDRWLEVIKGADPDIIAAVEIDSSWNEKLNSLNEDYPHQKRQPQDNYYGMVLLSRLPFKNEPKIEFLVQDDIPSIHAEIDLGEDIAVCMHVMHPRPPEPVRDQNSGPRDAELVLIGRSIGEKEPKEPTIVCGDLNDVAWSYTTQLFLRLSNLLDPRKGRGMFNSFDVNSHILRFPLDHVFHSDHFRLVKLERLESVGSDHFPMLIELSYEPDAESEQEEPETHEQDREAAEEIVRQQAKLEVEGEEEGHVSEETPEGRQEARK